MAGVVATPTDPNQWNISHENSTSHPLSPTGVNGSTLDQSGATVLWGEISIYSIMMFAILSFNGMVILAFIRFRYLRTVTNMLITTLAVCDMSMALSIFLKILSKFQSARNPWSCIVRVQMAVCNILMTVFLLFGKWQCLICLVYSMMTS